MNSRQSPRWEYKTLRSKKRGWFSGVVDIEEFEQELNRMGRQGWDLVNVTTLRAGDGGSFLLALFKRVL